MTKRNTKKTKKIPLKWSKARSTNFSGAEAIDMREKLGIVIYKDESDYYFCNREVTAEEFDAMRFEFEEAPNPMLFILN